MSLAADIVSSLATPVLFDQHGDPLTHRPLGNPANDAPVQGIFVEREPVPSTNGGNHQVRVADVTIWVGPTLKLKDHWLNGAEIWQVDRIGTPDSGIVVIYLTRDDRQFQSGPRGVM